MKNPFPFQLEGNDTESSELSFLCDPFSVPIISMSRSTSWLTSLFLSLFCLLSREWLDFFLFDYNLLTILFSSRLSELRSRVKWWPETIGQCVPQERSRVVRLGSYVIWFCERHTRVRCCIVRLMSLNSFSKGI